MGGQAGFRLLGLLVILSVLCDSGHSLRCYTCLKPGGECTNTSNCPANLDACLYIKTKTRTTYDCWKFENCDYKYLSKHFGESDLNYNCCQKDLCNKNGGMSITGTTALLLAPLLTAFWTLLS